MNKRTVVLALTGVVTFNILYSCLVAPADKPWQSTGDLSNTTNCREYYNMLYSILVADILDS